jgi:hypothetical protein
MYGYRRLNVARAAMQWLHDVHRENVGELLTGKPRGTYLLRLSEQRNLYLSSLTGAYTDDPVRSAFYFC